MPFVHTVHNCDPPPLFLSLSLTHTRTTNINCDENVRPKHRASRHRAPAVSHMHRHASCTSPALPQRGSDSLRFAVRIYIIGRVDKQTCGTARIYRGTDQPAPPELERKHTADPAPIHRSVLSSNPGQAPASAMSVSAVSKLKQFAQYGWRP